MTDGPGGDSPRGHVSLADLSLALGTPVRAAGDHDPDPALPVTGATLDSRRVAPGDLYAALPGAHAHGAAFAAQAAAAGAVVALTDPAGAERVAAAGLPALVVADPRAVLGDLAAAVHGHPGRALTTVGITGTNGKTTTAYLLEAVLSGAGWTTGLLGTVETRIAGRRVPSVRTTPEAPDLHALLARMVEAGVRGCALEVSSHALALHRVDGLVVDVAVFTNLSQDHLDFHGSLEEYFQAKALLFTPRHARAGVVAVDTEWGRRLAAQASVPVTTVRTVDGPPPSANDADVVVTGVRPGRSGSTFTLAPRPGGALAELLDGPLELTAALPGAFNVANAALAAVAALLAGVGPQAVRAGLAAAPGVPGRMERVGRAEDEPLVVVDYAHTPDALERVLETLRPSTAGRLVAVLGAGGDRDRAKRPVMGEVAARLADLVVVTDDNPRSEDPAAVRAAVLAGARGSGGAEVREVADRREAVAAALAACAGPQDTVLLAGKGHESGQEVAGVTTPFDDREVAAAALHAWRAQHVEHVSSPAGAAPGPATSEFGGRS
ncbi:UDP-N-acetylmuramoyl-L-alanyl-D-glutamate--2,6-diaminopimelate ligase [Kineococcus rubinsiae]|uniref:UDP-N-acetylmuramoyl-L-alanyl-D-glutamate--2, 6-diaminopimelate ligase n=1 Tax=Kineococcus rubinsiae TaxID=2609562 RepID=UPI00143106E2|nr:UDP-N-acetylmuramoyl-L-alanyl-D-glutamate--2,6-diaminopimelate ligase [Kineococcus rubinsiae]NIZ93666.1 UDP-N-acetylmuramoyl-L-alanyl-D-glutamate--2,6-diaminopimelate ligase [Kineococcus rubinsiae]